MHPRTLTTTVALLVLLLCGCRATAPMHAWTPPRLQSTVGRTVVLAMISEDAAQAERIAQAMSANRPPEISRAVHLMHASDLQRLSNIQLASTAANIPSDVALLSAARQQGLDYLLIGEILEHRSRENRTQEPRGGRVSVAGGPPPAADRLTVSWRLLDVGEARVVGGVPVTVSPESATTLHPDLVSLSGDTEHLLLTAVARETWKLLTPSIRSDSVTLAEPYLMPGSSEVRRGNALAAAVRWEEAEQVWRQVFERHPGNHAALHNLALAVAARQDFGRAKELAQQALREHSSSDYERTVVWIEGRQQELAEAFQIPPPEEGWLFAPN